MSGTELAAQEYHDVGQLAYDGGSHSQLKNSRGYRLLHQRPHHSGTFLMAVSEALADQAATSTGPRTGSCCCSSCKSAISVGEASWSGVLERSPDSS